MEILGQTQKFPIQPSLHAYQEIRMTMGILGPSKRSRKEKESRECRVGAPIKLHT